MFLIILFFLMISHQSMYCMEGQEVNLINKTQFGTIFEKFKIPANQRLSEKERIAISHDQYKKNIKEAHAALQSFTHHLIAIAKEEDSFDINENDVKQFEDYIINLRDGSLGLKPITVVDEITAIALATSKLNDKKKKSLQKEGFCSNQDKAHKTLTFLGKKTYKILKKNNLTSHINSPEYVKNFVTRKMDELSKNYGISNICLTLSNGETINFNNLKDLYTCLKIANSEEN